MGRLGKCQSASRQGQHTEQRIRRRTAQASRTQLIVPRAPATDPQQVPPTAQGTFEGRVVPATGVHGQRVPAEIDSALQRTHLPAKGRVALENPIRFRIATRQLSRRILKLSLGNVDRLRRHTKRHKCEYRSA